MTYLLQLLFYLDSDDEKCNKSNKSDHKSKYAGWSPSSRKIKSKFLLVPYYSKLISVVCYF